MKIAVESTDTLLIIINIVPAYYPQSVDAFLSTIDGKIISKFGRLSEACKQKIIILAAIYRYITLIGLWNVRANIWCLMALK